MTRFGITALGLIVLAMVTAFFVEHHGRTKLKNEVLGLKYEVQLLAEQLASLQQENARISPPGLQNTPLTENQSPELMRLRAEINQLRDRIAELELYSAAISNHISSATGANDPFIYPDSKRKKDYIFSGYTAPQSALQSVLWALTQSDARTFKASLAPEMVAAFASQFQDLPEGV